MVSLDRIIFNFKSANVLCVNMIAREDSEQERIVKLGVPHNFAAIIADLRVSFVSCKFWCRIGDSNT